MIQINILRIITINTKRCATIMFFLRTSKNFGDQNWEKEKKQHINEKQIAVVSLSLSKFFIFDWF